MPEEKEMTKEWFVGFIEGEGNFNVALLKKSSFRRPFPFDYYPMLQFRIFLREDDVEVLEKIQKFLGVGKIYKKKLGYNRNLGFNARDQANYVISNNKDISKLKEFLSDSHFFSKKKKDVETFFKIFDMKLSKRHLTQEGHDEIVALARSMNSGRRENFERGSKRKIYINKKQE